MVRNKNIELAEIPSDCESEDGLCPSDMENAETSDAEVAGEVHENLLESSPSNETEEDEDSSTVENETIWSKKCLPKSDAPSIKDFGPNISADVTTPLDIYFCLFPHNLLDIIIEQTDLYMNQKNCKQDPITKAELLVFLGINILMGVNKLPYYRDYWSSNPQLHNSYISSLMTVNRFGCILNHLHINDNTTEAKRGEPGFDKLYKIRPMLEILNDTFKNCWKPGKYQSVDESMIKFKGRSSLKQYMPAKPVKRGFKSWMRADESGYICEFQIYTGKSDNTEKQLGTRVVKDLTRELVGNNHHVLQDNYFTNPELLLSLKKENIFSVGTVRKTRRGLPKSDIPDKSMKIGDFEFKTSSQGLTWVKWMDKKPVFFYPTFMIHRKLLSLIVGKKMDRC